jgi:hypothetical protein
MDMMYFNLAVSVVILGYKSVAAWFAVKIYGFTLRKAENQQRVASGQRYNNSYQQRRYDKD